MAGRTYLGAELLGGKKILLYRGNGGVWWGIKHGRHQRRVYGLWFRQKGHQKISLYKDKKDTWTTSLIVVFLSHYLPMIRSSTLLFPSNFVSRSSVLLFPFAPGMCMPGSSTPFVSDVYVLGLSAQFASDIPVPGSFILYFCPVIYLCLDYPLLYFYLHLVYIYLGCPLYLYLICVYLSYPLYLSLVYLCLGLLLLHLCPVICLYLSCSILHFHLHLVLNHLRQVCMYLDCPFCLYLICIYLDYLLCLYLVYRCLGRPCLSRLCFFLYDCLWRL